MSQTRKIRWLLQHEPVELFLRTAVAFDKEIQELTDGRISVEMYKVEDYDKINPDYRISGGSNPVSEVHSGKIEMSQVQVYQLGIWYTPEFFALEMPYLFKDHEHATRVLEGPIGQKILKDLQENSPVNGLAFTYSGGYRVFASNTPIQKAEDLKGLSCVTELNPVRVDTAKAFGLTVVPISVKSPENLKEVYSKNSVIETTLPRYENEAHMIGQNHIADSAHSMYLTTIIVGNEFWNSLDAADQQAMRTASHRVAKLEREWSVADAEQLASDTEKHKEMGISYKAMSAEEIAKLKTLVEPVYTKYRGFFEPGFIDGIIAS